MKHEKSLINVFSVFCICTVLSCTCSKAFAEQEKISTEIDNNIAYKWALDNFYGTITTKKDVKYATELLEKLADKDYEPAIVFLISEALGSEVKKKSPYLKRYYAIQFKNKNLKAINAISEEVLLDSAMSRNDRKEAWTALTEVAENGHNESIMWASMFLYDDYLRQKYSLNEVFPKSLDKAERFAEMLMQSEPANAYYLLGRIFEERKNWAKAYEYFHLGFLNGDFNCGTILARFIAEGKGVASSKTQELVIRYACLGLDNENNIDFNKANNERISELEADFQNDFVEDLKLKANSIVMEIRKRAEESIKKTNETAKPNIEEFSSGTGFIISSNGLIVTAAHVIEGSTKRIEAWTQNTKYVATVLEVDKRNDLAVLRISGTDFFAAPLYPSKDVKLGQTVFTIGFPHADIQGVSPKLNKGEISSIHGIRDEPTQWQISVPVQSGNSGGPLFDDSGNVVGVVVSKLNAFEAAKRTGDLVQNVNYAVKNAYLMPMLERIPDKLPPSKKGGNPKDFESVVEDSKKSVVLILAF